jgi:nitrite reductase/ring-hydroxylating ferredoxin subunit
MAGEFLARLEEIPDGGSVRRELAGREVALFRRGAEVFALDAVCPHRRGPLDGPLEGDGYITVCPWHGWTFDVRTGKSPTHPGQVACHRVTIDGNRVLVESTRGGGCAG